MAPKVLLPIFCLSWMLCGQSVIAQPTNEVRPNPYYQGFVHGAQFQDLILPRPIIRGLESKGIWGGDNVLPRDSQNGIEDNQWCYWGGNPVLCDDGRYHMAICRWPERQGHGGWHQSEVAHCFSKHPLGPYQVTQTIIKKGHNPEVLKMPDGSFVLQTLNGNRVYKAKKMEGPWNQVGTMKLDSRGFRDHFQPQRSINWLGSNITTELRQDGNIWMMMKDGGICYSIGGVAATYRMVACSSYPRNTGYAEDPVMWRSRHQYHCVYNHAQDQRSSHIRSLDGVHWKCEGGLAYGPDSFRFTDGTQNDWYKFERPKVIQDSMGRATHLTLAVLDVRKRDDKGGDNHSSKNVVLPLVVERQIEILDIEHHPFENDGIKRTAAVELLIKAEDNFLPAKELDLSTLRLGSDRVVNFGNGAKAIDSIEHGDDLVVRFEGDFGRCRFDYDFKLLGSNYEGDLVFGYALLAEHSPQEATLVIAPSKIQSAGGKTFVAAMIENVGLSDSVEQDVVLLRHDAGGQKEIARIDVQPLKPYQSDQLTFDLTQKPAADETYRFVLATPKAWVGHWKSVDDSDAAVQYEGNWTVHQKAGCFRGSESVCSNFTDRCVFSFTGERARVYGSLIRNEMAAAEIYIDGEFVEKIALIFGNTRTRIYETPVLTPGPHTLELRSARFENRGPKMAIDYFEFESIANKL